MKCIQCGYDNLDKAKFCNECGHKLDILCPECKTANPPASKFNMKPELSRTDFEIGKRLSEPNSPYRELNGISPAEYLNKAKTSIHIPFFGDADVVLRIVGEFLVASAHGTDSSR